MKFRRDIVCRIIAINRISQAKYELMFRDAYFKRGCRLVWFLDLRATLSFIVRKMRVIRAVRIFEDNDGFSGLPYCDLYVFLL